MRLIRIAEVVSYHNAEMSLEGCLVGAFSICSKCTANLLDGTEKPTIVL